MAVVGIMDHMEHLPLDTIVFGEAFAPDAQKNFLTLLVGNSVAEQELRVCIGVSRQLRRRRPCDHHGGAAEGAPRADGYAPLPPIPAKVLCPASLARSSAGAW